MKEKTMKFHADNRKNTILIAVKCIKKEIKIMQIVE